MTKTPKTKTPKAYVVTTSHRGVFFGYSTKTAAQLMASKRPALKRARMCVYWPASVRGVLGLATHGPLDGSRVGPPADITLADVTAVIAVSNEAVQLWEAGPWK